MQPSEIINLESPENIHVEQVLLGTIISDNVTDKWVSISFLGSEDFSLQEHFFIYAEISTLIRNGKNTDINSIEAALSEQGKLEIVGGRAYLEKLIQIYICNSEEINIVDYAARLRELNLLRALKNIGLQIVNSTSKPNGKKIAQIIAEANAKLYELLRCSDDNGANSDSWTSSFLNSLVSSLDQIDTLYMSAETQGHPRMLTGESSLDSIQAGFQAGDLVIVARNKSSLNPSMCMNVTQYVALDLKLPVLIYSLGIDSIEAVKQMLSSIGKIELSVLNSGQLDDEDWLSLTNVMGELGHPRDTRIVLDSRPNLYAMQIITRARAVHRFYGGKLGLIFIDDIGLIEHISEDSIIGIQENIRALKTLAKELNVPVLAGLNHKYQ